MRFADFSELDSHSGRRRVHGAAAEGGIDAWVGKSF